jgi:predicted transposase/invertase (TIGR01784 family)
MASKENKSFPHDRFIRHMMTKPKVIEEFFSANLPANIKKAIALNTIKYKENSFISDKLHLQITDLLFSAEFNEKPGYLYLLVEHFSTSERLTPFRILKYMIAIMERHLEQTKTETLPIVYPVIIYAAKNNYTHSTDLFDLFNGNKELAKDILWQPYKLIDLTKTPDTKLEQYLWYGTMARFMKHIFDPDMNPTINATIQQLKIIDKYNDKDYIYTVFNYIFNAGKVEDYEEFKETVTTNLPKEEREHIMTLAESLIQKGEQKTLQKVVLNLLKMQTQLDKIAEATGLPRRRNQKT